MNNKTKKIHSTVTLMGPHVGRTYSVDPWDGRGDLVLRRTLEVPVHSKNKSVAWATAPRNPGAASAELKNLGYRVV